MRIRSIRVYQVDLPVRDGKYSWANNSFSAFDSTIVAVEADDGSIGFGECAPLGAAYLPAYAQGVRSGLAELGPKLIGLDPRDLSVLNNYMDKIFRGHAYVKSAIDVACWDILGKATGQPLWRLLGGKEQDSLKLYRAISQDEPEIMAARISQHRAEGYTKFQVKVGGDDRRDVERIRRCREAAGSDALLIADANTGWSMHQALRVLNSVGSINVYIEQPCRSYEECLSLRQRSSLPFILDESIDSLDALLRGIHDQAFDCVNLKIARLGGLTRTRQLRDLCASAGIAMIIEDYWGSDFVTAAVTHLAQSTPENSLLSMIAINSYGSVRTATGAPEAVEATISAGDKPGLGCEPVWEVLGDPLFTIGG